MPEFGMAAQEKLRASAVLCIGAGGLGSPAISYLAAAGVGRIEIIDADTVELSNLQRQLLFRTEDVGRSKAEAARLRVREINPHVSVEVHVARFSAANALRLAARCDVILDGSDNFATRYLSSDVAVWLQKPNVYGSVMKFEGQATVFAPHLGGPCYRCFVPTPPPPGAVPGCAEAGVLGVLPGMVGLIQATEVVKLLTGIGEPLIGRLLHLDARSMQFREFKLRHDPQCRVCGQAPDITAPIDYDAFCGTADACAWRGKPQPGEMTVRELAVLLKNPPDDFLLLDVREAWERKLSSIEPSRHVPLGELEARLGEVARDKDIAVHCKSGVRSAKAAALLRQKGYPRVRSVAGGMEAWTAECGR